MIYSSVFLRTNASLDESAKRVSEALGIALQREDDGNEPYFVALDGERRVALNLNTYDGEPFDGYSLDVEVDGREDDERLAYARGVFEKLQPLGLPLLLTDNLVEIDRFEPKSASAQ